MVRRSSTFSFVRGERNLIDLRKTEQVEFLSVCGIRGELEREETHEFFPSVVVLLT